MSRLVKRDVAVQDNTRVRRPRMDEPVPKTFTPPENGARIYDTKKARYYKSLQDFYNQNAFGGGLSGQHISFDYTTEEGQKQIQSAFDYAKNNVEEFLSQIFGEGVFGMAGRLVSNAVKRYRRMVNGVFRKPTKNGALGTFKQYEKYHINDGAESLVVDNTPWTVGKMSQIPREEMLVRNSVPNVEPSEYIGYVKNYKTKLPVYIQKKLDVLGEVEFQRNVGKLDDLMEKAGFRRVRDPGIQYRGYTDGKIVIDDISPGNVALDKKGNPKIIDMALQSVQDWLDRGYVLKKGGKL